MFPRLPAIQSYDVGHLEAGARQWRQQADQLRSSLDSALSYARNLHADGWQGQGGDGMLQALTAQHAQAHGHADSLESAAAAAENGAVILHGMKQGILNSVNQAEQDGFEVGPDWSIQDARHDADSVGWSARQPIAQSYATSLAAKASSFVQHEHQTAADVARAAGSLSIGQHSKPEPPPPVYPDGPSINCHCRVPQSMFGTCVKCMGVVPSFFGAGS